MDHPTVGRIVYYRPPKGARHSLAAIVTHVDPDAPTLIDLTVFPPGNTPYPVSAVPVAHAVGLPGWSWPPRA